MKRITTNKLQNELSKVIRETEEGEVYEVMRYSTPVAYLVPKDCYEKLVGGENCKKCMEDLRKIAAKIKR
jgi:prevent-host-death family protein